MRNKAKGFAIGALIIGAFGYIAGVLTAPKSGKETRSAIAHARDKGMAEAERHLKKLHTELNDLIGEAQDTVKDTAAKATGKESRKKPGEALEGEVVSRASTARQKTREILSALHDGNADDRDLDKAVAQASKAIHSLKKYLKK